MPRVKGEGDLSHRIHKKRIPAIEVSFKGDMDGDLFFPPIKIVYLNL